MSNIPALQQSPPRLPWRRALVTGASSGIGRALAQQLAAGGTAVLALGRDRARLQALADAQPGITPLPADLAALDTLPALAVGWAARWPDLDLVVHNAGVQHAGRFDADGYDAAALRHEIDVNLTAPLLLTQALLPALRQRPGACVVHIGSVLGWRARPGGAAVYSATKAGLRLADQALRAQLQDAGLRVVHATMPLVDTPMTAGRGRGKWPPERAARALLQGLAGHADEIDIGPARAARWLERWAPALLTRVLQRG